MASVGREQLHKADIQRLQPRQWLNDEIINFYGGMIVERAERWMKDDTPDNAQKRNQDLWFGASELGGTQPSPADVKRMNGKHVTNGNGHATPSKKGKERAREYGEPVDIHYFNTFFYEKLTGTGYAAARLNKWTKRVSAFLSPLA